MKVLVLFSGGLDSTTLLVTAINDYGKENVIALSISYGQKHDKEVSTAKKISKIYNVEYIEYNLEKIFEFSDCSLLKHSTKELPIGSYEVQKTNEIVSTYVPFRNGLFLSTAASIALSKNCNKILYGAHHDDCAGDAYPDCSIEFVENMNKAIYIGSGNLITLEAPFVRLTKADIVKKGLELNIDYSITWSCYEGNDVPCCKCATCIDRIKAFELNKTIDPLLKENL